MRVRRYCYPLIVLLLASGCATRPLATATPRTQTHAFTDTQQTQLGEVYGDAAGKHKGLSGFHAVNSGLEALMMRVALIEKAERSIDMQYYTTADDMTGQLLLQAIVRAAARGVRVRILIDDYYLDGFQKCAVAMNAHPHIEIRVFNPYSTRAESVFTRIFSAPAEFEDYDRRMHNKVFIVDNQVAIMGGRNLGDEYFDSAQDANLRDIDVLAAGAVVPLMSASFDRYWNSDESFPLSVLNLPAPTRELIAANDAQLQLHWKDVMDSQDGDGLMHLPLFDKVEANSAPLIWAPAEFVADSPAKVETPSEDAASAPGRSIVRMAQGAQREFIMFTPYFVPLDKGTEWLTGLVKRGVTVSIVTNSLDSTNVVAAQASYEKYREALVEGGVQLYEIKSVSPHRRGRKMLTPSAPNGLHAKIYMMDRRDLVLGSFNFDPRSAKLNTEQALIIHSPELCEKIVRLFYEVSSPDQSYKVILASAVPANQKPAIPGTLAWQTRENGKIVYYDMSPHAGFLRRITDGFFALLPLDKEL